MDQHRFLRLFKGFLDDMAQPIQLDHSDDSLINSETLVQNHEEGVPSRNTIVRYGPEGEVGEDGDLGEECFEDANAEVRAEFPSLIVSRTNEQPQEAMLIHLIRYF